MGIIRQLQTDLEAGRCDLRIVLIFAVVYLGMILGGLPFLQLDRTGVPVMVATLAISWLYLWSRIL